MNCVGPFWILWYLITTIRASCIRHGVAYLSMWYHLGAILGPKFFLFWRKNRTKVAKHTKIWHALKQVTQATPILLPSSAVKRTPLEHQSRYWRNLISEFQTPGRSYPADCSRATFQNRTKDNNVKQKENKERFNTNHFSRCTSSSV